MIRNLTPLGYALAYALLGWRMYPAHAIREAKCSCGRLDCDAPGKHPRIAGYMLEATSDPDCLRSWWQRWPSANVARVVGGQATVLDLERPGLSDFRSLVRGRSLPDTLIARSGGGGYHLHFRFELGLSDGGIPGLGDIRSTGALLLPGSSHASGGAYTWAAMPSDPRLLPAMPSWLLSELLRRRDKQSDSQGFCFEADCYAFTDAPGVASPGRTERLWQLIGRHIRERGLDEESLIAEALAWNARNTPPLPRSKVISHCRSLSRQERSKAECSSI